MSGQFGGTIRAWSGYRSFKIVGDRIGTERRSTKCIFTTRFFRFSAYDQTAVIQAGLRDIVENYGRYVNPEDEKQAQQQAARIRRRQSSSGY
jgi:hypothetical protein